MAYTVSDFCDLRYIQRNPKSFDPAQRHPVILYLHGSGTRGKAPEDVVKTDSFVLTEQHAEFPFVFIAPLCPTATTWFDYLPTLKQLVAHIAQLPYADPERIYLMGASMGAYGIWQLAMSMPEAFAAMLPICGGGMYWNAKRLVNIPVWAFHGGKDRTVFCEESQKMVDAVNKAGGNAQLTIYPDNTHNAWTDTYSNPEVFRWLLQHTRKTTQDLTETFTDAVQFG